MKFLFYAWLAVVIALAIAMANIFIAYGPTPILTRLGMVEFITLMIGLVVAVASE